MLIALPLFRLVVRAGALFTALVLLVVGLIAELNQILVTTLGVFAGLSRLGTDMRPAESLPLLGTILGGYLGDASLADQLALGFSLGLHGTVFLSLHILIASVAKHDTVATERADEARDPRTFRLVFGVLAAALAITLLYDEAQLMALRTAADATGPDAPPGLVRQGAEWAGLIGGDAAKVWNNIAATGAEGHIAMALGVALLLAVSMRATKTALMGFGAEVEAALANYRGAGAADDEPATERQDQTASSPPAAAERPFDEGDEIKEDADEADAQPQPEFAPVWRRAGNPHGGPTRSPFGQEGSPSGEQRREVGQRPQASSRPPADEPAVPPQRRETPQPVGRRDPVPPVPTAERASASPPPPPSPRRAAALLAIAETRQANPQQPGPRPSQDRSEPPAPATPAAAPTPQPQESPSAPRPPRRAPERPAEPAATAAPPSQQEPPGSAPPSARPVPVIGTENESISIADAQRDPRRYFVDVENQQVWSREFYDALNGVTHNNRGASNGSARSRWG